jgi:hypothetical protein
VGSLGTYIAGRRRGVAFAVLLALLTAAGGCGSSQHQPAATHSQRDRAQLTTRQLIRTMLLRREDFRSDWKESVPVAPGTCERRGSVQAQAIGASPSFKRGYSSVQQNVAIYRTRAQASGIDALLRSKRAQRCFYRALLVNVHANGGEGNVTPPRVVLVDNPGRGIRAVRSVVRAGSYMGPIAVYADRVVMQLGRSVSVLVMVELGHPIDEAIYERVLDTARARTARALTRL